jgi:cytochrome oxidase Cu insertion factor (SCO1/SenC/PrrC family)
MIESLRKYALLAALLAVALSVFLLSCAPAANEGQGDMAGMDMSAMAMDESDVDLKIGETTPPFTMVLANGSEVSSTSLAEKGRASHLFWFATW